MFKCLLFVPAVTCSPGQVQAVLLSGLSNAFLLTLLTLRHSRVPFLLLQQNLVDPVLFCRQ